jgi:hypothetical protein
VGEAKIAKENLEKDSATKTATDQKDEPVETKVITSEPSDEVKKQI